MMTNNTVLTLADTARTVAGDRLTRNQLKVIRARLRRRGVTALVPTVDAHYAVEIGSPLYVEVITNVVR